MFFLQEAQKDPTSFTELVRRLLRKCETELQRIRSAFPYYCCFIKCTSRLNAMFLR